MMPLPIPHTSEFQSSICIQTSRPTQVQSLKNILDYLYDVESKLASSADAKKEAGAEAENGHVPVAAGAGDMNNNCGGIVQVYWDRVLDLALDPELEIRQNALKVAMQHLPNIHILHLSPPLILPAHSLRS